jgi:hypothetical protein
VTGGSDRFGVRRSGEVRVRGLLACLTLVWTSFTARAEAVYQEADVKAVLIARVCSFIRWADPPSEAPMRPLTITVLSDPPLAQRLLELKGARAGKRSFEVRTIDSPDQVGRTDVLFIGRAVAGRLAALVEALHPAGMLTMSDIPGAAQRGVAINLQRRDDHLELEINLQALKRAGLTASYQLLSLARIVQPERRP